MLTTSNQTRQQRLLAYLLHRQAPQQRQHVAFRLWPDSSEAQAKTNLRRELYHLRRLLPQAEQFLTVDSLAIAWRTAARFTLDVADFEHLLAAAEQMRSADRPAEAITALEQALNHYHGPLLPSCYADVGALSAALCGADASAGRRSYMACHCAVLVFLLRA